MLRSRIVMACCLVGLIGAVAVAASSKATTAGPCYWTNVLYVNGVGVTCEDAVIDAYFQIGSAGGALPSSCTITEIDIVSETVMSNGPPCVVRVGYRLHVCCLDEVPVS